ncbi:MAG: isocitrate/isopropylmalate dehydrogenase family protein [Deltaproteobacteria bacterium]|nr:isocitrate/isopropylmalate dehydrogenase family protein [Deltaproteobacteria bacterium]
MKKPRVNHPWVKHPYRVTLIRGDGIGPEITDVALQVLAATGAKIQWDEQIAGLRAIDRLGTPLPEATLQSIRKNKVALKGPLTTPVGKGFSSVNVLIRKEFNFYANVRPVKSLPALSDRFGPVDLVIVRENTEDLYSGIEHIVSPGVVESVKVITRKASLRIANFAFKYAEQNGRKKVTAIHKANIMKLSDGLFLDCARQVAKKYPKIHYDELIVDNACMQLVLNPSRFDILLLENLYGDIVSDLAAGLIGGLGLVPGGNIGESGALFEAVHGSAPDIAGKQKANPVALVLSAAMMLDHLGEKKAADKIRRAVEKVLSQKKFRTPDLGGKATTKEMGEAIVKRIRS